MKSVLFILNYYYPYISGLSEFTRLTAEALAKKGWNVTVLCSNHAELAPDETFNGVHIVRTKVIARISKGTVSPGLIMKAVSLGKKADVINMNLPMIESGLLSLLLPKRKLITTYQCDINLPKSLPNNIIVKVMDISNGACLKRSGKILVTSLDYARNSRVARAYLEKCIPIAAPIKDYHPDTADYNLNYKTIGFCGRITEEKGIDILIKAFEIVQQKNPMLRLLIGGDYLNVAGGSIYPRLKEYIDTHQIKNVTFLGKIPEEQMHLFYSSLDVMALPSINSLEAFGMVQVEAMLCGVPVVCSDLPGVRTIVQTTKMGEIALRNNVSDLAEKLERVLSNKNSYIQPREKIVGLYGFEAYIERIQDSFGQEKNEH